MWNSETVRLRDFSFYLSSTFIYEPILIEIYMNAIIMNTQIFHLNKYDLKVIEGHKSSSKFSVNPTLALCDGPLMLPLSKLCGSLPLFLSLTFHLVLSSPLLLLLPLSISLFFSMQTLIYTRRNVLHKMKYDLKDHIRPLLCRVISKNSPIFWSNYKLD